MIRIEPFQPGDLDQMEVQESQRHAVMPGEFYASKGPCWSVFSSDNRLIFCGGFIMVDPGYALAWAIMAPDKKTDLLPITRATLRLMEGAAYRRIEIYTDPARDDAASWARCLGFELEGVKRKAMPDGRDMLVWARIWED